MSVKSASSEAGGGGEVVRVGYLKKLKTMRKKFFVLRAESADASARLEYYDSEKKYRAALPAKRSIALKACFNINRRVDTKHKHVVALYTKDDCFCVVLDSDRDLDDWLTALLSLQRGEDVADGEPPKPTFEHVWQVTMLNKGLGSTRNILGAYHLCFTDKTLSLVRKSGAGCGLSHPDHVEFSLMSIRRCGHSECFFYMEVGRSAVTGAGELWMQTEDTNIAQNMGEVILRAMSNNNKEELAPKPRTRSSSANEASKPILVQRRQTHSGQKSTSYCSPSQDGAAAPGPEPDYVNVSAAGPQHAAPSTATAASSTATTTAITTSAGPGFVAPLLQRPAPPRPSQRRHSVSAAGGASPWAGMAHHQRTQSLPLAPHALADNNNAAPQPPPSQQQQQQQARAAKRSSAAYAYSTRCAGTRERCDSMPSRARTSSEGGAGRTLLAPHGAAMHGAMAMHRPLSLYAREVSHSPPAGSPVSPASAACSTDSAGSSLSIDEADVALAACAWPDYVDGPAARYSHSLTPDEPIAEENCDEAASPASASSPPGVYVPMAPLSSDDGYVDMSPRGRRSVAPPALCGADMSPAASTCSITSGTPSTDMRFSEYHLEKVSSYFTPSEEDDTSSAERPARAYSVGSRPDALQLRAALAGAGDSARVRAFSVGSRAKGPSRVLPPHGHAHAPAGAKSSSAPLLSAAPGAGSHSSMERMDDLMEMDFSRPEPGPSAAAAAYMDMSPHARPAPPGYVEMRPGAPDAAAAAATTPDLPYMDMRPAPATSPLKPSSVSSRDSGYMDMRPSTSPHKPSVTTALPRCGYYVDMQCTSASAGKLGTSPKSNKAASPIEEEYMDMEFQRSLSGAGRTQPVDLPQPRAPAAGYMDMSWAPPPRQSSLEGPRAPPPAADDYMNMSAGRRKERRGSKKDKARSQPIAIQAGGGGGGGAGNGGAHSPVGSFASFLRKGSAGTPPKHPPTYLPLGPAALSPGSSPFSSLRRPRSRKGSRRDSRDSSGGGGGLATPTGDPTIFPFSPSSPVKPFHSGSPDAAPGTRKCAVDASSGTVRLSAAARPPHPATTTTTTTTATPDYARMSYDFSSRLSNSADYTEMSYGGAAAAATKPQAPTADLDYVNYCPAAPAPRLAPTSGDDFGEYAVMRPGAGAALSRQLSSLSVGGGRACVFRPIGEPGRLGAGSPRPGDVAPPEASPDGGYETLSPAARAPRPGSGGSLSRPSSVSSELGSTCTVLAPGSRPASVSSERELHYASLDLAPADDDGTRSPRTAPRSPTPGAATAAAAAEPAFTYAEIDFIRSEGLKQAAAPAAPAPPAPTPVPAAKVKH